MCTLHMFCFNVLKLVLKILLASLLLKSCTTKPDYMHSQSLRAAGMAAAAPQAGPFAMAPESAMAGQASASADSSAAAAA